LLSLGKVVRPFRAGVDLYVSVALLDVVEVLSVSASTSFEESALPSGLACDSLKVDSVYFVLARRLDPVIRKRGVESLT